MKTTDNFKLSAPCCYTCKHVRVLDWGGYGRFYYCDSDGTCPRRTQEEWDYAADHPTEYDPNSPMSKWHGFDKMPENHSPDDSIRYVGALGIGICDKYEHRSSKNESVLGDEGQCRDRQRNQDNQMEERTRN